MMEIGGVGRGIVAQNQKKIDHPYNAHFLSLFALTFFAKRKSTMTR